MTTAALLRAPLQWAAGDARGTFFVGGCDRVLLLAGGIPGQLRSGYSEEGADVASTGGRCTNARSLGAEAPSRKLELYGEHLLETAPRSVPVQLAVRAAAAGDPAVAEIWEQMLAERLTGMTLLAHHLYDRGHLRAGISLEEARDVLWTYISTEVYELLVLHRGWTPERYARWVVDALTAALLARSPRARG